MARQEADREDLFEEALALRQRIELIEGVRQIVAGFRSTGAFSLFYGQDVVMHLNPAGHLRRGYLRGVLLRAEAGRKLTHLHRDRQEAVTLLVAHECTQKEVAETVGQLKAAAEATLRLLSDPQNVRRAFPADSVTEICQRVECKLQEIVRDDLPIADGLR